MCVYTKVSLSVKVAIQKDLQFIANTAQPVWFVNNDNEIQT